MKTKLKNILEKIIKNLYNIENPEINLENPPKKDLWDFAFAPFLLAKDLKKSPVIIWQEIITELKKYDEIAEINQAWPYINIKLSKNIYSDIFFDIYKNFWKINKKDENIFIDYIWPNVWKPLHIGHMCTPNIGQTIINAYRFLGYNVISDSHIWDWGGIFWKLIVAYKKWWDEEQFSQNPINHLLELYIKITSEIEKQWENSDLEDETRKTFKKLSSWDEEYINLWKKFTKSSIEELKKQLKLLNVKPDYNIWESFYEGLNLPKLEDYPDLKYNMSDIVSELLEKNIATKNEDNSVWVVFDEKTKIPSCILEKRDWAKWYLASDLAAIKYRIENWNPKKIIYFVDLRQSLHFRQVFEIAKNANWLWNTELIHAWNGFISLKDGAMSTRKWKIVKLENLLDEAQSRAKKIILEKRQDFSEEKLKELSKIIGIWAIKYGYLKKSRENNSIFDWDEFMTFEGNSGPYIQYSYVRAIKILQKWDFENKKISIWDLKNCSFEFKEEIILVKFLADFENILLETIEKNMPHILCSYVFDLTKAFNSLYNLVNILSLEDEKSKNLKLLLVDLFAKTIKKSFEILAIDLPDEM